MDREITDIDFLKRVSGGPEHFVARYFADDLAAKFPHEQVDSVLYSYLAYLGRSVIRAPYATVHVDHVDPRTIRAMADGSNPGHGYFALSTRADRRTVDLLHALRKNGYRHCELYRMDAKQALAADVLGQFDTLVLTNICDVAAALDHIRQLTPLSRRSQLRVILHGDERQVDRLLGEMGALQPRMEWAFAYPGTLCPNLKISSIALQAGSAGAERVRSERVQLQAPGLRFEHLSEVPQERLLLEDRAWATVLPDGSHDISVKGDIRRVHYDAFTCASLRGVRLAGHSIVVTADGQLVQDSLCAHKTLLRNGQYWEHPICSPRKEGGYWLNIPAVGQHCYEPALLVSYAWEENYQHWLLEVLPQVLAARRLGIQKLVVSSDIRLYQRRAFELLGFGPESLVVHDLSTTLYCDHLVVGSYTAFNMGWVHPGAFDIFDTLRACPDRRPTIVPPELVYISRSDAEWKRRLVNERELSLQLEAAGFVSVNPGALSFDDEVEFLSKAKVIVAPIGAGLSNLVFAAPGAAVVAIQSPSFGTGSAFFPMIASLRGASFASVDAVALNPDSNEVRVGENDNINLIVDCAAVLRAVEQARASFDR